MQTKLFKRAHKYLYSDLCKSAKKRKKAWELTELQVETLVGGDCFYCGAAPALMASPKVWKGGGVIIDSMQIYRNGIDRIDSSKGYIPGNVVPCCQTCNKAKLEMSVEEFKAWISRVYNHLAKPLT